MKKIALVVVVIVGLQMLEACTRVPITGRKQMNLLPESEMMSLALTSYTTFLKQSKVDAGTPDVAMVQRVGQRISRAVNIYLAKTKNSKRVAGYKWEFNLVEKKGMNAWLKPG